MQRQKLVRGEMDTVNFTVVIAWCKCGHNNMQHKGTISEDFKLSKKVLCTVCDCEDFEEVQDQ